MLSGINNMKAVPLRELAGMGLMNIQQFGSTYLLTLASFDSNVTGEKGECNASVKGEL